MYYYSVNQTLAASFLPDLPFPSAEAGIPTLFLLNRDPNQGPAVFRATHVNQLFAETIDITDLPHFSGANFLIHIFYCDLLR